MRFVYLGYRESARIADCEPVPFGWSGLRVGSIRARLFAAASMHASAVGLASCEAAAS